MSEKEFYTVREIILGTRKLYIENQKIMSSLKNLTESYDKQVRDYYFEVATSKSTIPHVRCKFIQNMNTIRGRIIELKKKMNLYGLNDNFGDVVRNDAHLYEIKSRLYQASVSSGEEEKFANLVDQSLNSDFISKLNFSYIRDRKFDIMITPIKIVVQSKDTHNSIVLFYEAKTDHIEVFNPGGLLNASIINYILNYKVSVKFLSHYHREFIEQSAILQKDIHLKSYNSYRKETIIIDEKDCEVDLVRVRSLVKKEI